MRLFIFLSKIVNSGISCADNKSLAAILLFWKSQERSDTTCCLRLLWTVKKTLLSVHWSIVAMAPWYEWHTSKKDNCHCFVHFFAWYFTLQGFPQFEPVVRSFFRKAQHATTQSSVLVISPPRNHILNHHHLCQVKDHLNLIIFHQMKMFQHKKVSSCQIQTAFLSQEGVVPKANYLCITIPRCMLIWTRNSPFHLPHH